MNTLPKLAIVGRPNVGKSALFNRICRQRKAIVDEAEGITRDRLYGTSELFGFPFEVIDTGGITFDDTQDFNALIRQQAEIAIEEADAIILVVDGQVGITELDEVVSKLLLKKGKNICLAVNKIDTEEHDYFMHNFYQLGIKNMVGISAVQGRNIAELLEAAWVNFDKEEKKHQKEESIQVAIVGRPNVGKSTLLNHLLDEDRSIVSPLAGTTRDSIDVPIEKDGQKFVFIDTAGIRRKKSENEVVDKFAFIRTERSIKQSHVCLFIVDATEGLSTQDKRILTTIEEEGKSCILLINKWDLVKGYQMEHCLQALKQDAPFLKDCPQLFISASSGRNLEKIYPMITSLFEEYNKRISTGQLNKFLERTMQLNHPPMIKGKRLRVYFMTQAQTAPPTFVMFINYKNLVCRSYMRYLLNQFRKEFGFAGVPFKINLRQKKVQTKNQRLQERQTKALY
ncbi:MAG: ribosome biogenesis GTPase Der [Chlamydiales bacterium]|nr:ribosome biogenesis GTPase Der [Chlamydiales bacterium]NCF70931.1 ribosome biogenesis GTPase Der [Chlamydiales bacterium]